MVAFNLLLSVFPVALVALFVAGRLLRSQELESRVLNDLQQLVPWRAIWPGASAATIAIAIADYAFPAYLNHISTIARVGTTFVFVLIVLIWFYALALIILGGAIANAMRFEQHEGEPMPGAAD